MPFFHYFGFIFLTISFKLTPLPTATAAAGVDICKIHFSMFSKAELILLTICGLPQARDVTDREFNNIKAKVKVKIK